MKSKMTVRDGVPLASAHAQQQSQSRRRGPRQHAALLLVVLSTSLALSACGTRIRMQSSAMSGEDKAEWQEAGVVFPAAPAEADLLPFEGTSAFKQRFAVDAKSMTLGTDGVVRYTLVSYSTGGVRNVSYEGIRCETYESKIYALGRADGAWSAARRSQWQRIVSNGGNSAQATLAQDYVCVSKANAGDARDMVRRLQLRQSLIKELIR